jgi:hypothetical protein
MAGMKSGRDWTKVVVSIRKVDRARGCVARLEFLAFFGMRDILPFVYGVITNAL